MFYNNRKYRFGSVFFFLKIPYRKPSRFRTSNVGRNNDNNRRDTGRRVEDKSRYSDSNCARAHCTRAQTPTGFALTNLPTDNIRSGACRIYILKQ